MQTLLLMRHAKSDWSADYEGDHERPLSERGVRSARIMGRLLAVRGLVPDVVISSSAVRASTTAALAIEAGDWSSTLQVEELLYGADVEGAIEHAKVRRDVGRLMLVGHQPTWSMLAEYLTGEAVEMKTGAIAVVEWAPEGTFRPGSADLSEIMNPREHFGSALDF